MDDHQDDRRQNPGPKQPVVQPPSLRQLLHRRKIRILRNLLIYFVAALAWIFFTDRMLFRIYDSSPNIEAYSLIKGILFVILSCIPFYLMLAQRHVIWQEATRELETRETQAYQSAFFDSLTQLPNSRFLETEFNRRFGSDRATQDTEKAALIYFDIDELRQINELGSFQQGNELLQFTAHFLRSQVRSTDLVVRVAFDEFAILIHPLTGSPEQVMETVTTTIDRLWRGYQQRWETASRSFFISASIGAALYPEHADNYTDLMQKAEAAMTACKMKSKNDFCLYSDDLQISKDRRTEQLLMLRHAIADNQLILHYQPQYDLQTGVLRGLEALVRWQDPERGLIMPGEFIPLAETSGLMLLLDRWVLDRVQQQRIAWHNEKACPDVIAINVSSNRFNTLDLEAQLEPLIIETDRLRSRIEIEITETVMLKDPHQAVMLMRRLNKKGIQFALDDFGSGYASLNYLKNLPLDLVKIDRQFIQAINHNPSDALIVETIIKLSHQLGLKVIAEGIETEEQLRALQKMNCDYGQGYYLGYPEPPEKLSGLLRTKIKRL